MIGAKSIVLSIKIANKKNVQSPYKVQIQANKNFGLCDVILPGMPVAPEPTYLKLEKEDRKKEKASYDVLKAAYDMKMAKRKAIRNAIFDRFQGRQLNSDEVVENLKSALYYLLNAAEL